MRCVLAVDDEPGVLRLIQDVLETAGFAVLAAKDAEEALTVLEHHHVDVLLTDLIMPGMCGAELIEEVRRRHPQVATCCMTGYVAELDVMVLNIPILTKPFKLEDLIGMVEGVAEQAARPPVAKAHH